MIYSRMDNNFELVPIEIKGVTGWIYLYLRSFVGWILSFFDIYEIKERFFHKPQPGEQYKIFILCDCKEIRVVVGLVVGNRLYTNCTWV